MSKKYKRWTESEVNDALRHRANGMTYRDLATILGRTPNAVYQKLLEQKELDSSLTGIPARIDPAEGEELSTECDTCFRAFVVSIIATVVSLFALINSFGG